MARSPTSVPSAPLPLRASCTRRRISFIVLSKEIAASFVAASVSVVLSAVFVIWLTASVILFIASVAPVTTAMAADVSLPYKAAPAVSTFSWTGCYLGGNSGGGRGMNEQQPFGAVDTIGPVELFDDGDE